MTEKQRKFLDRHPDEDWKRLFLATKEATDDRPVSAYSRHSVSRSSQIGRVGTLPLVQDAPPEITGITSTAHAEVMEPVSAESRLTKCQPNGWGERARWL